jgi:uncharacterized protein (TIGR03067 family)
VAHDASQRIAAAILAVASIAQSPPGGHGCPLLAACGIAVADRAWNPKLATDTSRPPGEECMRAHILAMMVTVFLSAVATAEDAAKKDLDKLQGFWESTSAQNNGEDISGTIKLKLKIKGNEVSIDGTEEVTKDYGRVKLKLDPSTTPKSVDLTVTAGGQKDIVLEGIYEIKDDELKICVKIGAKERPTKFDSPAGSSIAYMVFQRVKP